MTQPAVTMAMLLVSERLIDCLSIIYSAPYIVIIKKRSEAPLDV